MRFKVDLNAWQDLFHAWIIHERQQNAAFDRRFKYDKLTYRDTRDMMVNMLWNEVHRNVEYDFDRWDVDSEVDKWFDSYYPYPGVTRHGLAKDTESVALSDILEQLENRIASFATRHSLHTRWHIYELYNDCREIFILEMFGDWRAREYCKEKGMKYEP